MDWKVQCSKNANSSQLLKRLGGISIPKRLFSNTGKLVLNVLQRK
jgi:hypothetical protein